VLGLYVQMPEGVVPRSISGLSSDRSGFLLQAGGQYVSYFEAWRLGGLEAWRHIVQYEAGRWEDLVLPMLELAEFFTGYFSSLGSIGGKVNTITVVGQHYQETGTLQLPDDD